MKLLTLIFALSILTACATPGFQSGRSNPVISQLPHPRVHFPFNRDDVTPDELALIDENADWMNRNRSAVIILEGHCDEWGPSSYNMQLGDLRARTVKARLIELGVSYDRIIMVVSYGEKRPIDGAHTFDAWRKNRRVAFVLR